MIVKYSFIKNLINDVYYNPQISKGTVQFSSKRENNVLYITFASTNSDLDVYNHLFSYGYPIPETKDKIHIGWYLAFLGVFEDIINLIQKENPLITILVGHSYGGALAYIAGYFLKEIFNIRIISIASPRIGNKSFMDKIFPIVVKGIYKGMDIIPLIPFWFYSTKAEHTDKRTTKEFFYNIGLVVKNLFTKKYKYFENTLFYQDHVNLDYLNDVEIFL